MTNLFDQAKDFLFRRRNAYCKVFLQMDGQPAPYAEEVLADLARFCRANQTCFHEDPRVNAALEGRREVWLRLQQHLRLSEDQLQRIYLPNQPSTLKETSNG